VCGIAKKNYFYSLITWLLAQIRVIDGYFGLHEECEVNILTCLFKDQEIKYQDVPTTISHYEAIVDLMIEV